MPALFYVGYVSRRIAFILLSAALLIGAMASARVHAADYVIHISVDGLNASVLQSLIDAGQAANFKRFEDEGTWTINARADYSFTITLPNHMTILTGRPVLQPEDCRRRRFTIGPAIRFRVAA